METNKNTSNTSKTSNTSNTSNTSFLNSQKCLPKLKMDIYKCPKMENRESNMEKPLFVTIIEI